MDQITVQVSQRSIRRVQIAMAAMQATEQTAKAAAAATQGFVEQARRALDDALGAICDANDQRLPDQYSITVKPDEGVITIIDNSPQIGLGDVALSVAPPPPLPVPINGKVEADDAASRDTEGIIE